MVGKHLVGEDIGLLFARQIVAYAKLEAARKMEAVIRAQMKLLRSDSKATAALEVELQLIGEHIKALEPGGEIWPEKVADWASD